MMMSWSAVFSAPTALTMAAFCAAVISNEMRLSEAIGRFGLGVVTKPSHAIPGVKLSHANPESHDNDCGMTKEFE